LKHEIDATCQEVTRTVFLVGVNVTMIALSRSLRLDQMSNVKLSHGDEKFQETK
jgi:hypothetical protein